MTTPADHTPDPQPMPTPMPTPAPAAAVQPYQPAYQPSYQPAAGAAMAAALLTKKSPGTAGVLSFFLPGVGQFMNGSTTAGILFLSAFLINLPFVALFFWIVVPVVVDLGIGIWAAIHAVQAAQQHNQRVAAQLMRLG